MARPETLTSITEQIANGKVGNSCSTLTNVSEGYDYYGGRKTEEIPKAKIERPPMPDILPRELRRPSYSVKVAMHELQHALPAYFHGDFLSLSIEPNEDSLGRTYFNGYISTDRFCMYAAASGVSSDGYSPEGTAGDESMVYRSGRSWSGSVTAASAELSKIPNDIRKYAAQIIACRGYVNSSEELCQILQQAEFDMREEMGEVISSLRFDSIALEELHKKEDIKQRELPQKYTIIDNLGDNNYRIIYVEGGVKTNESIFHLCPVCNSVNGHKEDCPMNNTNITGNKINPENKEDVKEEVSNMQKIESNEADIEMIKRPGGVLPFSIKPNNIRINPN